MHKMPLNTFLKGKTKMKAKNKNKKENKKKLTQAQKNYIAIGVMAVTIIAIVLIVIWPYITPPYIYPDSYSDAPGETEVSQVEITEENFLDVIDKEGAKKVEFTMNDGQSFTIEVYPKVAPITCENFLALVDEGFYNGLSFHRVIPGFMAQGGAFDPVNQENDPAKSIKGEFSSNGFENSLRHFRGVVSMARTPDPDSASSQFFICYGEQPHLDGEYASFGYVTEGMETVDSFLSEGTDANDVPLKEVKIKKAERVK